MTSHPRAHVVTYRWSRTGRHANAYRVVAARRVEGAAEETSWTAGQPYLAPSRERRGSARLTWLGESFRTVGPLSPVDDSFSSALVSPRIRAGRKMKPIVWVVLALSLVGCSGTNYVFESTDATADVSGREQRESGTAPDLESGEVIDAVADNVQRPPDVFEASSPRDASLDARRDGGEDDAARRDSGDGSLPGRDAAADGPCVPSSRALACANAQCGLVSDGCTGTYACGTCLPPRVCAANTCQCPLLSDAAYCANHGYTCGAVIDTCSGATHNCGRCLAPQSCGGSGHSNVCGCTPLTACPVGDNCGTVPNGCGGVVACGPSCSNFDTCGGGGIRNQCGCTPLSSCPSPTQCGTIADGCGGSVPCAGSCSPWQVCGPSARTADAGSDDAGSGGCPPNVCCAPCAPAVDPSCPPLSIALSCDPSITPPGCSQSPGGTTFEGGAGPPTVGWCCP